MYGVLPEGAAVGQHIIELYLYGKWVYTVQNATGNKKASGKKQQPHPPIPPTPHLEVALHEPRHASVGLANDSQLAPPRHSPVHLGHVVHRPHVAPLAGFG